MAGNGDDSTPKPIDWRAAAAPRPVPVVGRRSLLRRTTLARLPSATVAPSRPGAPWWRYRRPAVAAPANDELDAGASERSAPPPADAAPGPPAADPRRPGLETAQAGERPGLLYGVGAALCALIVVATSRADVPAVGRVLIPAAGILAAIGFGEVLARRHPDERWLARLLVLAVAIKLIASLLRYYTLIDEYGGAGDATIYHEFGTRFFDAWTGGGDEPPDRGSVETNWVRWFTGVVYYVFGPDIVTGFFIFALLAVVGTYLWYRAAVIAVPFLDKRLYFLLAFFLPSIAFWPSAIGKEALMQLGIGAAALGTAHMMNQRLVRGLLVALPGGWLLWRVRPHLLAFVVFAAGAAYLLGRVRRKGATFGSTSLLRPLGMVIIPFLVFFAFNEGTEFLGMEQFSINSVEEELNENTGRSDYGGSTFEPASTSLTPLTLPLGLVTVLLRPFPWEVDTPLQILASLECAAVTVLILRRLGSLSLSLTRLRTTPFLMYCWILVLLYAVGFSSLGNFGVLVRQRSLVLPALFVLLALDTTLVRGRETDDGAPSRRTSR